MSTIPRAEQGNNESMSAALEYAEHGWQVIPVHTLREDTCSCSCGKQDCGYIAKHPRIKEWQKNGSTDPKQIRAWWRRWPDANVGLVTGRGSGGLLILDVDPKDHGEESLAALERQYGRLPDTWTVRTGSGGWHYYFTFPASVQEVRNSQSKIAAGLDIRAEGGMVVAPPSLHRSGRRYVVQESAIPPVESPAWLPRLLAAAKDDATPHHSQPMEEPVKKGRRTQRLCSLAGTMHRRGMTPEAIEAALLKENEKFDPPLPEAKVRKIAHDIPARYPRAEEVKPNGHAPDSGTPTPSMTGEEARHATALLLDRCRSWIKRYCVMSDEQADVTAAWVLHTYTYEIARHTPYLRITSPVPECGKSTLIDTLETITCRPIRSGGMTPAVLVRIPEAKQPTLLMDEMDATFNGNRERAEDIRGILNEGHKAGGVYYKCVGKNHELHGFPVYCPKAFAGIGGLPATVMSRSIPIEMRRKLDSERVEFFDEEHAAAGAAPIKTLLSNWAEPAKQLLRAIKPERPAVLRNRHFDNAKPLLAIAVLAGGDWPDRLTKSLQALFKVVADDPSVHELLLRDLREIFGEREKDSSENLVHALWEIEGRPWAEWSRGQPMTKNQLARELKRFKIFPKNVRVDNAIRKGYERADFTDAWGRFTDTPLN